MSKPESILQEKMLSESSESAKVVLSAFEFPVPSLHARENSYITHLQEELYVNNLVIFLLSIIGIICFYLWNQGFCYEERKTRKLKEKETPNSMSASELVPPVSVYTKHGTYGRMKNPGIGQKFRPLPSISESAVQRNEVGKSDNGEKDASADSATKSTDVSIASALASEPSSSTATLFFSAGATDQSSSVAFARLKAAFRNSKTLRPSKPQLNRLSQ